MMKVGKGAVVKIQCIATVDVQVQGMLVQTMFKSMMVKFGNNHVKTQVILIAGFF